MLLDIKYKKIILRKELLRRRKELRMEKKERGYQSPKLFDKEDLQEFAKLGQDLFKKTVGSKIESVLDNRDQMSKEILNTISKSKGEILSKLFSKDVLNQITRVAVDRVFEKIGSYRIDVSISLKEKKNEEITP